MLAVLLDLSGKPVLVVGGGPVGQRKAEALLAAGAASVRLVAREAQPESWRPARVVWLQEAVEPRHLEGVALVVTATNPEVDAQVIAWARERGLWVNAAGLPEAGDLLFPATVQRGRVIVSVSTAGAAPALAHRLVNQIQDALPEQLETWVDLLEEARCLAKELIPDARVRRDLAVTLARLDGPAWLAAAGVESVRNHLRRQIEELLPSE